MVIAFANESRTGNCIQVLFGLEKWEQVDYHVCLEKRPQRMLRTRMKSETRKSCQNNTTFSSMSATPVFSTVREFVSAVFCLLSSLLVSMCVCQQLSICHNYSAEFSRRLWLTLSTRSWDLWSAVCFLLVFQMGNQKNHLACSWLWGKERVTWVLSLVLCSVRTDLILQLTTVSSF